MFTASAQVSRRRKRAAAVLHTVLHLAVVVGVVDLLLQLSGVAAADPWMRAVLGGAVGALLGPLVVAVYLWIADHFRVNSNELYAGCANEAYKNFLRLHIDHTGLTVYPIGVRRPTGWTFDRDTPHDAPATDGARRLGRAAVVPARGCDRARADREAHPHTAMAPLRTRPARRSHLTTAPVPRPLIPAAPGGWSAVQAVPERGAHAVGAQALGSIRLWYQRSRSAGRGWVCAGLPRRSPWPRKRRWMSATWAPCSAASDASSVFSPARRSTTAGHGGRPTRAASPVPSHVQDLSEVRAWLAEHGYPVKERGRIPDAWVADYDTKSPNSPQQQDEPTAVEAAEDVEPKRSSGVEVPVFQAGSTCSLTAPRSPCR